MFFNRIRDTLTYLSSSTCLHFIMNTVIDDDSQFKTHLIDVEFAGPHFIGNCPQICHLCFGDSTVSINEGSTD